MMVAVVILGVLLNIALPGLIRARETSRARACIKNLQNIDAAKEQYALQNNISQGSYTPVNADLYGAGKYIKTVPACPTTGPSGYTINAIGTGPVCIIGANLQPGTYDDHIAP